MEKVFFRLIFFLLLAMYCRLNAKKKVIEFKQILSGMTAYLCRFF